MNHFTVIYQGNSNSFTLEIELLRLLLIYSQHARILFSPSPLLTCVKTKETLRTNNHMGIFYQQFFFYRMSDIFLLALFSDMTWHKVAMNDGATNYWKLNWINDRLQEKDLLEFLEESISKESERSL
jgi:hypothetical protein